jgi:hypothetical protein
MIGKPGQKEKYEGDGVERGETGHGLSQIAARPSGHGHGDLSHCYRIGVSREVDSTLRFDAMEPNPIGLNRSDR